MRGWGWNPCGALSPCEEHGQRQESRPEKGTPTFRGRHRKTAHEKYEQDSSEIVVPQYLLSPSCMTVEFLPD